MTEAEIRETFRYHSANPEMVQKHEHIRAHMTKLVVEIAAMLPLSAERMLFIRDMQRAQMMANAAIAIHSKEQDKHDSPSNKD